MKIFSPWAIAVALSIVASFTSPAQVGPGNDLQFNYSGTPGFGEAPGSSSLSITGPITVEAWLYGGGLPDSPIIEKFGPSGSGLGGFGLRLLDQSQVEFRVMDDAGIYTAVSGPALPAAWTHVAGVWDGATLYLYYNGVLQASTPCSENPKAGNTPLYLGTSAQPNDSPNPFLGDIDEVRIWNVARAASDIQQNMNYTVPGSTPGLVAYYRFDEASGTNCFDSSPNGNTLALHFYGNVVRTQSTAPIDLSTLPVTTFTTVSATLSGTVNTKGTNAYAYFQYSTDQSYSQSSAVTYVPATTVSTEIDTPVSGLTPSTVYYYRFVVTNASGSLTVTNIAPAQYFVTVGAPLLGAISASGVAGTVAQLNTSVYPNDTQATVYFNYGTDLTYGNLSSTVVIPGTNAFMPASFLLTGLTPQTTYDYQAVATNSFGVTTSVNGTFTTTAPTAPICVTGAATGLSEGGATLNGTVNPNGKSTTAFFQYGVTTDYGQTSATASVGTGTSAQPVGLPVSGLTFGTAYHYQLVASNNVGEISYGADQTFTTSSHTPPAVVTIGATNILVDTATLIGNTLGTLPTTVFFNYGTTTNLGSTTTGALAPASTGLAFSSASTAYADIPSTANIALGTPLTFEAWIYPTVASCDTILSRQNDFIFQVGYNGSACGSMHVGFYAAGAWDFSASTVPLNTWTHVAVTYDGVNKQFFINGVLDQTAPRAGTVAQSGTDTQIGRQGPSCNCNFFNGSLAEIRVWNTVLPASQIAAQMNTVLTGSEAGLTAYYKLNEGSGTTIYDTTDSGINGTVHNAVWTLGPPQQFEIQAANLVPGTTYYYQAVGNDGYSSGYGAILSFSTPPFQLTQPAVLGNGNFQFNFTGDSNASFSVWSTTNLSVPFSNWTLLGPAVEGSPGSFSFTDTNAPGAMEFYGVSSP